MNFEEESVEGEWNKSTERRMLSIRWKFHKTENLIISADLTLDKKNKINPSEKIKRRDFFFSLERDGHITEINKKKRKKKVHFENGNSKRGVRTFSHSYVLAFLPCPRHYHQE